MIDFYWNALNRACVASVMRNLKSSAITTQNRVRFTSKQTHISVPKGDEGKLSRVAVVRSWKAFEGRRGSPEQLEVVEKKEPKEVKKKKLIKDD